MLNFKDWKLAATDETKATLQHANGHTMTIAMKALPRIQREQIKRLARVQQFEAGSPDTVQADDSQNTPPPDRAPDSTDTAQAAAKGGIHFTINTGSTPAPQAPPAQQPPVSVAQPAAPQAAPTPVPPDKNPAAVYAAKPVDVTVPNVPNAVRNLRPNGTMNPAAVAQNAQEAVRGQGLIDAAKTDAASKNEEGYLAGEAETQKTQQALYNQMTGHVEEFNKYIQDHPVNPNAYIENMNGGKKTMAGLGLILGGMGAGKLGSADNPALRFLNQQIDRDIEGQKTRINNQKTVLGAYQHLYGEGVASNNLTKASLLDIYAHKAQLLSDKLGTPQAKVAAQQLGANVALEKSKLLQEAAVNLSNLPGTAPTSSDDSAMNTPRPSHGSPADMGKEGPVTAGMTTEDLQKLHDEQSRSPVQAGMPGSASSAKPQGTHSAISPILTPNAQSAFLNARYNPQAKPHYDEISKQYNRAVQADKQLQQLAATYQELEKQAEAGGMTGRAHRTFDPESVPTGGGDIATGVIKGLARAGAGLTNTDTNRLYDANKTKLVGAVSAALKGTNIGDHTIHEIVNKNAPEYGDSDESKKQKLENIADFIKSHTDTSVLAPFGMTR